MLFNNYNLLTWVVFIISHILVRQASSVHQYFLEWEAAGVFEKLWKSGLMEYDEMEGIAWDWQSLDGAMVKAPLALEAVGKNPVVPHVDIHGRAGYEIHS